MKRRQRGSGERGVGDGSAALKGGEVAAARFWRAEMRQSAEETRSPFFFETTRTVACMHALSSCL